MGRMGVFGQHRVFLQQTETTLYLLSQTDVIGSPSLGSNPLPLTIVTDIPSVLPVGKSWDGWLETDEPAVPEMVGAIIEFNSFEFEKPYDQGATTKVGWDSIQEGLEIWYQSLR